MFNHFIHTEKQLLVLLNYWGKLGTPLPTEKKPVVVSFPGEQATISLVNNKKKHSEPLYKVVWESK